MFLISEEQILAGPVAADPDLTSMIEPEGGPSVRPRARSARPSGSLHGARGLAIAGLATGTLAFLAALELAVGGGPAHRDATSPPRSPLISRSAARVPADPRARVHPRAARPVEVQHPSVVHHHRPRPVEAQVRPTVTVAEPEREPTLPMAPVSRPAVITTEPTAAPEVAPQAAAESTDPGPPPSSSSGGGPGVESFGFER